MAGKNGTASVADAAGTSPGILHLPDIAYERELLPVTILGQRHVFNIWVRGPGCPGRIVAEYERHRMRMARTIQENGGAYAEFLTDALRTISEAPADQYDVIDLLAGDIDRAELILRHHRWYDQEAAPDPEATSEDRPTSEDSSLISSPPTAASAPTAAAG